MKKGEPETFFFQDTETKSWNPSMETHRGLNRKGIGPKLSPEDKVSEMGLWSKVQAWRISEVAKRPRVRKEE